MSGYYIFTDKKGKVLDMRECPGLGEEAYRHRVRLRAKHGKPIVDWAHMGGTNPEPIIK